jgi:type I restriction enzyme, S subunit
MMSDNWKKEKLGNYIKLKGGFAFKSKDFIEKGYAAVLRISNIKNNGVSLKDAVYISKEIYELSKGYLLQEGDLVIAMSGATTGKTGVIKENKKPLLMNQRVGLFEIKEKNKLSETFLAQYVQSDNFKNQVLINAIGGAQPNISGKQIEDVCINLPPLHEQHKIAEILTSVDGVIEKTKEIIGQSEKVKKGLMQQLLTKGIGNTKFKKTVIGDIPEEWEVKTLGEITKINPESLSGKTDPNFEFNYIDIASIIRTGEIGETKTFSFGSAPSRARRIVREGDIIVSTVRPYLRAFSYIHKENDTDICSTGFAVLRPNKDFSNQFIYQIILSNQFVEYLKTKMTGSNYPAVKANDISEYRVAVPKIDEQNKIGELLKTFDKKIKNDFETLNQLQLLKQGLMQNLLTGKVRVKIDEEEVVTS